MAVCGGVDHDSELKWCFGFAKDTDSCSCLKVEFWGIYEGLTKAWSLGYSRVILGMDGRKAYDINLSYNLRKVGSYGLLSIFKMMTCPWEFRFAFVCHEGNALADAMARLIYPGSLEYRHWLDHLLVVRDVLLVDREDSVPMAIAGASECYSHFRGLMMTLGVSTMHECGFIVLFFIHFLL
ncbi:hypothetical protein V6N12_058376 [Hibiscus sabdariffa]|uniref:RNase H type-1 domain-containing protein n=1 Tax=Hibiscus sabdariffa TaxID=183260 RepID=A0ABR2ES05_9ROSI